MKARITKRDMLKHYKCYACKAEALHYLFEGVPADYYTEGLYGWNADIYVYFQIAVVTGYRSFGVAIPQILIDKYETKAKAIKDKYPENTSNITTNLDNAVKNERARLALIDKFIAELEQL